MAQQHQLLVSSTLLHGRVVLSESLINVAKAVNAMADAERKERGYTNWSEERQERFDNRYDDFRDMAVKQAGKTQLWADCQRRTVTHSFAKAWAAGVRVSPKTYSASAHAGKSKQQHSQTHSELMSIHHIGAIDDGSAHAIAAAVTAMASERQALFMPQMLQLPGSMFAGQDNVFAAMVKEGGVDTASNPNSDAATPAAAITSEPAGAVSE